MATQDSTQLRLPRRRDPVGTGWTVIFLVLLTSMLLQVFTYSSARAQSTATPGPGTELAPGGWQPSSNSYPAPGTEATGTPTQPIASPLASTATPSPSPTIGIAATTTSTLPVPVFPTLTPEFTLAAPVITTTTGLTTTATLIPLPELTLVFPQKKVAGRLVTATPDAGQPPPPWTRPQRLVPLALAGMIWVILAGWFYYSHKEL